MPEHKKHHSRRKSIGNILSAPFKKLLKNSHHSDKDESTEPEIIIDHKAPGKVRIGHRDYLKVGMEPGPDGDTLQIARRSEGEKAVVKIQAAFRRYKARELFESLKALDKMNLELAWPDGVPFIGLLIVKVNNIKNLSGVRAAHLRTKFDGDSSVSIQGVRHEGQIQFDHNATFVNVVVKSNSMFVMEILQSFELAVRLIGKIHLPLSVVPQGVEERNEEIRSPSGEVMGVVNMHVGYQWLRGTTDYGGYSGPEIIMMPARKIRGSKPRGAMERLWKVNHWVCSHDNIWCVTPSFKDVVQEAVQRERQRTSSIMLYDEEGKAVDGTAVAISPDLYNSFLKDGKQATMNAAELLQTVTGVDHWSQLQSIDSQPSLASSTDSSIALKFGNEDLKGEMLDFTMTMEDIPVEQIEEEVNYDYKKAPAELVEQDRSSETSSEPDTESRSDSPVEEVNETPGAAASPYKKKPCKLKGLHDALTSRRITKPKKERLTPCVAGNFEYGPGRPASSRAVHVFAKRGDNASDGTLGVSASYLGAHETNKKGKLVHPLPNSILRSPGIYNILALLPDDNTWGGGNMFLLEKGTKCIIFDLDGTITTSDVHVVAQTLLDSVSASTVIGSSIGRSYDIRARPNALSCVRAWAAKGYQVVYLSGRQGSAYNMTLDWLDSHGYPPGPIHLTRTHLPTLPVYVSVGHFKIKYMEELKAKGLELYAAYGNTGTDIKAYEHVGIPKERTFIVGSNSGKKSTRSIKDFTTHLPEILLFPDSEKPVPYTELLRASPNTTADL